MGCRPERKPQSVHTCKVQVLVLAIALGSGIEMNPLVKYKVSKAAESDRGIIHPCRLIATATQHCNDKQEVMTGGREIWWKWEYTLWQMQWQVHSLKE